MGKPGHTHSNIFLITDKLLIGRSYFAHSRRDIYLINQNENAFILFILLYFPILSTDIKNVNTNRNHQTPRHQHDTFCSL